MDDRRCFSQETVGEWLVVTRAKAKSNFILSDIEELFSLDTPSGKPWARLIFLGGMTGVSKDARYYFKTVKNSPGLCCAAIISRSPIANVFGNYFLSLNATAYPRKLFDSEDMAMEWIKVMIADARATNV